MAFSTFFSHKQPQPDVENNLGSAALSESSTHHAVSIADCPIPTTHVRRLPLRQYPNEFMRPADVEISRTAPDYFYNPSNSSTDSNILSNDLMSDAADFARDFPWRYLPALSNITGLSWKDLYREQSRLTFDNHNYHYCDALDLFKHMKAGDLNAVQRMSITFDLLFYYENTNNQQEKHKTCLAYAQINNHTHILNWIYEQPHIIEFPLNISLIRHQYVENKYRSFPLKISHSVNLDNIAWAIMCRQPIELIESLIDIIHLDRETLQQTLLIIAAQSGHTEFVLQLLKKEKLIRYGEPRVSVVDVHSDLAKAALHIAVQYGHLSLLQALHAHGADVSLAFAFISEDKLTPLEVACMTGNLACFHYIYSHAQLKESEMYSLVRLVTKHKNLAIMDALISLNNPTFTNEMASPETIMTIVLNNDCEMLQMLEYNGIDINPLAAGGYPFIPNVLNRDDPTKYHHPYLKAKYGVVKAEKKTDSWWSSLIPRF